MLKIYNTLGRELQDFRPIHKNNVKFYQCGPTVYSRQHIGNLYSALKGDLIRRALEYLGYEVTFARNITDVGHLTGDNEGNADDGEDKMAKGSKKEGLSPSDIAQKYTKLYHEDIQKLNVRPPDFEPIATKYVDQMAEMVQVLINKGFAYSTSKAIYFNVDKFPEYNKLNLQKLDKNKLGAGHGDVYDSEKKNPYDFSLWFYRVGKHNNALQFWIKHFKGVEQPTAEGFPGWHIECSAMSLDTLGKTIDIHMGGVEHISVHHTNEIAQSECANETNFANYWIHHELIMVDGEKMSKSLGNVYTIDDLEANGFSPLDYRYFSLQAHHRSKQNFTWEALTAAKNAREKLEKIIAGLKAHSAKPEIDPDYKQNLIQALEDDFNIPRALGIVWELLKSDLVAEKKLGTVLDFDKVMGLGLQGLTPAQGPELSEEVKELIRQRKEARDKKDWATADSIRDKLKKEFGVEVVDK
ncbi:MAG: cysteine--tRNA ligase [Candidatus Dojkabacteria bacterium]